MILITRFWIKTYITKKGLRYSLPEATKNLLKRFHFLLVSWILIHIVCLSFTNCKKKTLIKWHTYLHMYVQWQHTKSNAGKYIRIVNYRKLMFGFNISCICVWFSYIYWSVHCTFDDLQWFQSSVFTYLYSWVLKGPLCAWLVLE